MREKILALQYCMRRNSVIFLATLLAVTITSTAIGMAGSAQKKKACYRLTSGKDSKMCRLFLHNLNHFCDLPNACEVPVDPSLAKYFSVPKWEIVNVEDHLNIVAAYIRIRAPKMANCDTECMVRKREQEWQEYKPELLKRIKDGRINLVRSRINIRHDDESRMAYRLVDNVCAPDNDYENYKIARRPGLMIVDEKTGKPDKYYSTIPLSNSVLLYEGNAYLIDLDFLPHDPAIYNYARVECQYNYEGNRGGQR